MSGSVRFPYTITLKGVAFSLFKMSSWFGNSFTSLTDQITTFTKDVLNETTQEIEGKGLDESYKV